MRQRELGISQLAGTQDMPIDAQPSFASPGRGTLSMCTIVAYLQPQNVVGQVSFAC